MNRVSRKICLKTRFFAGTNPLKNREPCRNEHGFTLMEVLVATAITGIALGVLLSSFALGHRQAFRGDLARQAASAAQAILFQYNNDPDGFPESDSGDIAGLEGWSYSLESRELVLQISDQGGEYEDNQNEETAGFEIPELLEVTLKITPPGNIRPFVLTLWANAGRQ